MEERQPYAAEPANAGAAEQSNGAGAAGSTNTGGGPIAGKVAQDANTAYLATSPAASLERATQETLRVRMIMAYSHLADVLEDLTVGLPADDDVAIRRKAAARECREVSRQMAELVAGEKA